MVGMRKATTLAAALVALSICLVSCTPPPPPPPPPITPVAVLRNQPVSTQTYFFTDFTARHAGVRRLPGLTGSRHPDLGLVSDEPRTRPYPLVMFAHGYGADPSTYAALLARIAERGLRGRGTDVSDPERFTGGTERLRRLGREVARHVVRDDLGARPERERRSDARRDDRSDSASRSPGTPTVR